MSDFCVISVTRGARRRLGRFLLLKREGGAILVERPVPPGVPEGELRAQMLAWGGNRGGWHGRHGDEMMVERDFRVGMHDPGHGTEDASGDPAAPTCPAHEPIDAWQLLRGEEHEVDIERRERREPHLGGLE